MHQVVLRLEKGEEVRFISHLDLMRVLERAMRRAGLPLAYTEGYNPRPRVSWGPALATGTTGEAELAAVELARLMDPEAVRQRLNSALPPGIRVRAAWVIPPHSKKVTFGEIDTAEYLVSLESAGLEEQRIRDFLSMDEVWWERGEERGRKRVNLRPMVREIRLLGEGRLTMRLRTGPEGGTRPEEVLRAMGLWEPGQGLRVHRTAIYSSQRPSEKKRGFRPRKATGQGGLPWSRR